MTYLSSRGQQFRLRRQSSLPTQVRIGCQSEGPDDVDIGGCHEGTHERCFLPVVWIMTPWDPIPATLLSGQSWVYLNVSDQAIQVGQNTASTVANGAPFDQQRRPLVSRGLLVSSRIRRICRIHLSIQDEIPESHLYPGPCDHLRHSHVGESGSGRGRHITSSVSPRNGNYRVCIFSMPRVTARTRKARVDDTCSMR